MRAFLRTCFAIAFATFAISSSESLAQETKKEVASSVSGRVTLGDKPLPRITVMLSPDRSQQRTLTARAITDDDGRYRLTGIPPGSYSVEPFTPALVGPAETAFSQPGKSVTLGEAEEVEGVDFSLTRGAVITGRVTDADGRPLIEQYVNLIRVDERGQRMPLSFSQYRFSTDDRGVYRVYGLAPGRYKISVGESADSGTVRLGFGGGTYARTFHPDVAEETRATIVEAIGGSETNDVDIKLGRPSKTYVATGRVVDADSGKPLPNLLYGHGPIRREQPSIGSFGWTNNRTNENGEFRLEGLSQGRYAAFVIATEQVDSYSEPAVFDVNDSDVGGLEIKVRRGSSINGIVAVEGSDDPEVLVKMSKLELVAFNRSEALSAPRITTTRINPDGSFRILGLQPGKTRLTFSGNSSTPKGFSLLRVEREGVDLRDGLELSPGENVSGVKVVVAYGTGIIRGQVKFEGGQVTPDMRFRVSARRLSGESPTTASTAIDTRGRFSLEGLLPGEYELVLNPVMGSAAPPGTPGVIRSPSKPLAKQNVNVANGSETEVTLLANLATKDKDSEK